MRVKCLDQEHNTMSPARARTRTARSGDKRINHEASPALPQQAIFKGEGRGVHKAPINPICFTSFFATSVSSQAYLLKYSRALSLVKP